MPLKSTGPGALLAIAAATFGCAGGDTACDGPPSVIPFAPALSEPGMLFRGAFAADARTFYYFKKVTPNQEDYRIFRTRLVDDSWTAPERVDLGGDYSDLYPTISADGQVLVFSSYRPVPGDTSAHPNAHLWTAQRAGADWGTPRLLDQANLFGHYHSGPIIGANGAVRFTRTTPDWRDRENLVTMPIADGYGPARAPADPPEWSFPPEYMYWSAVISPDGETAILLVGRRDRELRRVGPSDLWFSRRNQTGWSAPQPFAADVNTDEDEGFPFFSPDGCRLLFTRAYTSFQQVSLAAAIAAAEPAEESPAR